MILEPGFHIISQIVSITVSIPPKTFETIRAFHNKIVSFPWASSRATTSATNSWKIWWCWNWSWSSGGSDFYLYSSCSAFTNYLSENELTVTDCSVTVTALIPRRKTVTQMTWDFNLLLIPRFTSRIRSKAPFSPRPPSARRRVPSTKSVSWFIDEDTVLIKDEVVQ